MGMVVARPPVPIDEGFVPPTLNKDSNESCNQDHSGSNGRSAGDRDTFRPSSGKEPSYTFDGALKLSPRFFLLGEPGSGKTTSLRHATWRMISDSKARVPIFVRIAEWR